MPWMLTYGWLFLHCFLSSPSRALAIPAAMLPQAMCPPTMVIFGALLLKFLATLVWVDVDVTANF